MSAMTTATRVVAHSGLLNWLRAPAAAVGSFIPRIKDSLLSKVQATADLYPIGFLRSVNHLRSISQFWTDVSTGTLPSFSIVDPDFTSCSEENPQDIQAGEGFAAKVINAVMSGPAWPKTLLIWVYDEHGGYYDHVPPPSAPAPVHLTRARPLRR
jgi:phospholipase C